MTDPTTIDELLAGDRVALVADSSRTGEIKAIVQCSTHGDWVAEVEWDGIGGRDLQHARYLVRVY